MAMVRPNKGPFYAAHLINRDADLARQSGRAGLASRLEKKQKLWSDVISSTLRGKLRLQNRLISTSRLLGTARRSDGGAYGPMTAKTVNMGGGTNNFAARQPS